MRDQGCPGNPTGLQGPHFGNHWCGNMTVTRKPRPCPQQFSVLRGYRDAHIAFWVTQRVLHSIPAEVGEGSQGLL